MTKDVSAAVKRAAARGNKMLRDRSDELYAEWGRRMFFPSTIAGGRGATSPLGGQAIQTSKQLNRKGN